MKIAITNFGVLTWKSHPFSVYFAIKFTQLWITWQIREIPYDVKINWVINPNTNTKVRDVNFYKIILLIYARQLLKILKQIKNLFCSSS